MGKEVIQANKEMTGGNCYVYYGRFSDGTYFSFCLNTFIIWNADYGITFTQEFYDETEGDTYQWEQDHLLEIYNYPSKEVDSYVEQTFEILKRKE